LRAVNRRCAAGRRFSSACAATRSKTKAAGCFRRTQLSGPGLPVTSATSTPRRPAPGSRALRGVRCARGLWPWFARASAASSSDSISDPTPARSSRSPIETARSACAQTVRAFVQRGSRNNSAPVMTYGRSPRSRRACATIRRRAMDWRAWLRLCPSGNGHRRGRAR
jgi:hypothetical protein